MAECKVSVIVPVYNVEAYLAECLSTIAGQTLKDIEVICVDDGSTDGSMAVLEQFEKQDSRFRILRQQNSYAGVARNYGLSEAVGEYVVFWDSDDMFQKDALMSMYNKCIAHRADICICSADRYDTQTGQVMPSGVYIQKKYLPEKLPFSVKSNPRYIFNFTTNVPWNKMFRRAFVETHHLQFQALKQANDAYFSMMALFYADRITVCDKPFIRYRINNQMSLTGKASDTVFCVVEAYKAIYDSLCGEAEFEAEVRRSFCNKALNGLLYSVRSQTNADSYEMLYTYLKREGFKLFGVSTEAGAEYFYSKAEYEDLCCIEQQPAMQYLLGKYKQLQIEGDRRVQQLKLTATWRIGRVLTAIPAKIRKRTKII